ncbi:MAG TPA: ATPase, T2SS/T4P/T4SS family, partial [Acidimicrobiia bacterium]|nr:ATPase, T2SS/T4P/T4SS family [Acidimicrobiia bacterium]
MEIHGDLGAALSAIEDAIGTDLVLTIGQPPLMRLDGKIAPVPGLKVVDASMMRSYLDDLLEGTYDDLIRDRDVDFAFSHGPHRFRGNVFFQRGLPAVALRLIQQIIPTFDEIGLPHSVRDLISKKQGLILFCGPTGSGKSTSMATMVDAINASRPCHIITIEDPIEYLHTHRHAVVHQREVGIDA